MLNTHIPFDQFYLHSSPHYNTLQHTATHCNTLQHTAPHCTTLLHTTTHCNTATTCTAATAAILPLRFLKLSFTVIFAQQSGKSKVEKLNFTVISQLHSDFPQ